MSQVFGCVTECDAFVTHTVIVHHHLISHHWARHGVTVASENDHVTTATG
jgi:hypothetical protein